MTAATGRSSGVDDERPDHEAEQDGEHEPLPPERAREDEAEVDRQAERDEDGELAEVGERRVEVATSIRRGNSASPITIPATNTARKPEPCATAAMP